MGLELQTRASLKKKKGLIFSSTIPQDDVVIAILNGTKGTPLHALSRARELEPGEEFALCLHPAAETVFVRFDDSEVTVSAKTSSAGPGYHAFVVSCLDSAQKALGLQWQWDADSDEAGYMPDRNFAALQTNMAAFLKRLAISQLKAIDARGATGLQLFMSDGFGAEPREGEIFTHIGPVTAETLQRWAEASGDAQITNAAAFFPWWGKGFDGGFYRGLALYELWSQCRWAPPLDDAEREQIKRSISWCTEAQKLGAPPPIPESELAELRALATSDAPQPIKREGTGFRRRMWRWSIGDNWALRMPGEMVSSIEGEDDDPTYVFSTNDLDIRASVYVAPSDDPDIRAGAFDREISMVERRIERLNQTVAARTLAKTFAQGDRTRVCVLTITSTTPETRDLGQTIGQSLTFEPD